MKALMIDDDPDFLKLMEVTMGKMGFETTTLGDPQEIFKSIVNDSFDVVLVDWMMPMLDGISVIKAIRARDARIQNKTKIVMVTAIGDKSAKKYAHECGADAFVQKGSTPKAFKQNLTEALDEILLGNLETKPKKAAKKNKAKK
jgi:DNA-binding response OmpR family regulator